MLAAIAALGALAGPLLGPARRLACVVAGDDGDVALTADISVLLAAVDVRHAAGPLVRDAVAAHAAAVGTGSATLVALAGLLASASRRLLREGVGRPSLRHGLREAADVAERALRGLARPADPAGLRRLAEQLQRRVPLAVDGEPAAGAPREPALEPAMALALQLADALRAADWDTSLVVERRTLGPAARRSAVTDGLLLAVQPLDRGVVRSVLAQNNSSSVAGVAVVQSPSEVRGDPEAACASVLAAGAGCVAVDGALARPLADALAAAGVLVLTQIGTADALALLRCTGARPVEGLRALRAAHVGCAAAVELREGGYTPADEARVVGRLDRRPATAAGRELRVLLRPLAPPARAGVGATLLLCAPSLALADELGARVWRALHRLRLAAQDGALLPGAGAAERCAAAALRAEADARVAAEAPEMRLHEPAVLRAVAGALEDLVALREANGGAGDTDVADVLSGKVAAVRRAAEFVALAVMVPVVRDNTGGKLRSTGLSLSL